MNKLFRLIASTFLVTALFGCAGTDFKRPDPQTLQVGKSTAAQVIQVMGPPLQTGEVLRNGEKLKILRYSYAEGAGTGKYPGVTPGRTIGFLTFNDLLVMDEFISSFPTDATDFDETKIPSIVKGKTTKAEVIALLGKPNGNAVYPYIKNKDESAIVYSYAHVKGSVFNMKLYAKNAVVSLDAKGVVTEVEYTSTGEK